MLTVPGGNCGPHTSPNRPHRPSTKARASSHRHTKPVRCNTASANSRWLKPCVGLGGCLADQSEDRTWPITRSMTVPQEIAVSLIVAVCAAATGGLAWSVVEFVYWMLM